MSGYIALPTKNPGDVLTSALWNTYLQGNADSGFVRKLADSTLVGSVAAFDFTSVPATFAHLLLMLYLRCDDVATITGANIRFNGDTGANYDFQYASGSAAAVTATESFGATAGQCGLAPAASAAANLFGVAYVFIPHYAAALNNKAWKFQTITKFGTASGNITTREGGGFWRSSAAINQVTVVDSGGGNFVAGSRATLLGLPA